MDSSEEEKDRIFQIIDKVHEHSLELEVDFVLRKLCHSAMVLQQLEIREINKSLPGMIFQIR